MTLTDTPPNTNMWRDDAENLLPDLVELRRAIHREP